MVIELIERVLVLATKNAGAVDVTAYSEEDAAPSPHGFSVTFNDGSEFEVLIVRRK